MATPKTIDDIQGWFWPEDRLLFSHFLGGEAVVPSGDLVELGTFLGKSTVLIGDYLQPGEQLVALDLFHNESDEANVHENQNYPGLTRERFEANYLAFHDELPVIVEGPSTLIVDHVKPGAARFIHVDASHLYEHVASDVQSSRRLLAPGGVAVFDDYRAVHTPGVAAAVWEAVVSHGFRPFLISPQKMYGTFDTDTTEHRHRVLRMLDHDPRWTHESESILGHVVIRASWNEQQEPAPASANKQVEQRLEMVDKRLQEIDRKLARQARQRNRQFRSLSEQIGRSSVAARVIRKLRG